jgi:hypothetical protein
MTHQLKRRVAYESAEDADTTGDRAPRSFQDSRPATAESSNHGVRS